MKSDIDRAIAKARERMSEQWYEELLNVAEAAALGGEFRIQLALDALARAVLQREDK